jgi:uncharacterized membrane protein
MAGNILAVFLSWIHILTVIIWGGGAVFLTFILTPKLTVLPPQEASKLGGEVSKLFTKVGWTSIVLIALTGLLRMYSMDALSINFLLTGSYGNTLLLKILIFAAMVILITLITKTGQNLEKASSPQEAMALQKRLSTLSKTTIYLGLIVVFLSVGLRYGGF